MSGDTPFLGCTVTTSDLLPNALVLAASFRDQHPETPFVIVCLDRAWLLPSLHEVAPPGVELLPVSGLPGEPFPTRALFEWKAPGALRVALPGVVRGLLERHGDVAAVVAFAPWIQLHAPISGFVDRTVENGWCVVPKLLQPFTDTVRASDETSDTAGRSAPFAAARHAAMGRRHLPVPRDRRTSEVDLIVGGTFSTDLIAFHRGATPTALDWLDDRMRSLTGDPVSWDLGLDHAALVERVLDVAVQLHRPSVVADAGLDVAPWNFGERSLAFTEEATVTADGGPLITTNHAGFDLTRTWTARPDQSRRTPWDLNDVPAAAKLWSDYAAALDAVRGHAVFPTSPEGAEISTDVAMSRRSRRSLRRDTLRRSIGQHAGVTAAAFDDLSVSGAERLLWIRHDTIARLHPLGEDESRAIHRLEETLEGLVASSRAHSGAESGISDVACTPGGVDIVGHLRSVSGLGEAGRRLQRLLMNAGVPTTTTNLPMSSNPHRLDLKTDDELHHDVMLAVINGDYMEHARRIVGPDAFDRRYVIGQWAWETEDLPLSQRRGFPHVDEIWANSTYVRDIIDRYAPEHVPVLHVPAPVETPTVAPDLDRHWFGLDDRTVFLFLYDHLSTIGRKNPLGTIAAYRAAFDEGDGAVLVLKSINGTHSPETYEEVRAAAGGRSDILVVDAFLSRTETDSLLGLCDVYVSLHRSEGLGFTMAEAMLLGRPVIASAYGGNLDFMDETSAVLIPTTSGRTDRDYPPYFAGSVWAEPDLGFAAQEMRRLAEDEGERARLGAAAAAHASAYFDAARCTRIVLGRLAEIRSSSASRPRGEP